MTFRSDYDRLGFKADEIYTFLTDRKIGLEPSEGATVSSAVEQAAGTSVADWFKPFIGRYQVSLRWAAAILAGVDLDGSRFLSDDEGAEIGKWQDALIDAIEHQKIAAGGWGADRGEQMLSHDDIRTWCASRGHVWPIPEPNPQPVTDAELLERLRIAEAECASLKRQLTQMSAITDDRTQLCEQISALKGDVSNLTATLDAANAKIQALEVDQLQGKSRTVALKLIGGLAMTGHGIDIHADRLDGIGEILSDLAGKGISVSEQTLRDRLKDAAEHIERRNPNP
ncbi:hypothetical protein [Burkholderia stagnalis]|uniref:hypothetical protein n=1 Tax=Burkholderia stagnalis TaxID=1503054 RepID=UPI000F5C02A2|nr:hypothetical protein [Burkholderia stagnalis]RQQ08142.1 hypothetical protein DF164_14730 [Burkholderia stagnalis]